MKIRTDFVTNSSSSSFIMAFKNKSNVLNELFDKDKNDTQGYFETIARDILDEKYIMTREDAIAYYQDYLDTMAEWDVNDEISSKYGVHGYKDRASWKEKNKALYEQEINNYVKTRMDAFMKKIKGKNFFSIISYGDEYGESELEFDICPYLDCCAKVISHH